VYPATHYGGLGNPAAHHGGVLFIYVEYHSVFKYRSIAGTSRKESNHGSREGPGNFHILSATWTSSMEQQLQAMYGLV